MSNFHIGQKVVCVNAEPRPGKRWYRGEALKKRAVYTVARVLACDDGVILHLQELCRCKASIKEWKNPDLGYAAERFRPVKITSIDVFTAMLAPPPRVKRLVE